MDDGSTAATPRGDYIDSYSSPLTYNALRTEYVWNDGLPDADLVRLSLEALRGGRPPAQFAVEVGPGDGRMTRVLEPFVESLTCYEPSQEMAAALKVDWTSQTPLTVIEKGIEFSTLSETYQRADLVTSFWSLSYAVQAYFGIVLLQDDALRQVIPEHVALPAARNFLRQFITLTPGRQYLLLLHDPSSVEQTWVTEAWNQIVDVSFGRDIFVNLILDRVDEATVCGADVTVTRVKGITTCEDGDDLEMRFLGYHLRNLHLRAPTDLRESLHTEMEPFLSSKGYLIPAGVLVIYITT